MESLGSGLNNQQVLVNSGRHLLLSTKKQMTDKIKRDLGEQPIGKTMMTHGLEPHDLVENSTEQITYKMISRAIKGRRLTPNVQCKILSALNKAAKKNYTLKDLFNY